MTDAQARANKCAEIAEWFYRHHPNADESEAKLLDFAAQVEVETWGKANIEIERLRALLVAVNPLEYFEMADKNLECQFCHAEGVDDGAPFDHKDGCAWFLEAQRAKEGKR